MRVTQHATKVPMSHWRNQRGIHKIAGDKWKWKHNDSNSMGFSKNSSKREDHIDKILFQENKLNEIPNTTPRLEKKKVKARC